MATTKAPQRSLVLQRRETLVSYLFLLPALFFFVGFVITPMAMGVITSFTDASLANGNHGTFIGFTNYIRLFQDPVFLKSAVNTVIIVVVAVPTVTGFSLWVGSAIYKMRAGVRSFFRCVFYLPVVTGSVAVVVVWKWMFDKYDGLFNYIIGVFGGKGLAWTGDAKLALWCIILILFTTSIGQPIVLYVAALGNVDSSLVEAAQVDGATNLQVFWKIKWPSIMPTTLYVAVITTINSFQCFALIQLLTSGGPNYSTSTVMYYLYETAFRTTKEFGYADAMGVILAIVIALFSALQFKVMNGGTTE
ncbi:MAG: sugar ABC transporter permease [Flavonifractor sp.]|jgi:multiple sugar transport system permease protein|nr:sugar ABC transporter permease [Flavonifractor sp.]MCI9425031.1 sugar ABC transporter permease [Flavonifractor sp.]MCI9472972.1 sugar ABC transporter permease [Flavonifractor sp.]